MAMVRWSRPVLKVSDEATGRRRNLDRVTWQDVLDAVGSQEMELRRLHAEEKLSNGGELLGTLAFEFTIDRDQVVLHHVDADPRVKRLEARVARVLVSAPFKSSPTPMRVTLECTFTDGGGWDPGGGSDPFGNNGFGGGREDRAFGDPF